MTVSHAYLHFLESDLCRDRDRDWDCMGVRGVIISEGGYVEGMVFGSWCWELHGQQLHTHSWLVCTRGSVCSFIMQFALVDIYVKS